MTHRAEQSFTVTRHAYDARADHRQRTIHMSMTEVSIERVYEGVKMAIAVPVAAYPALTIRVCAPNASAMLTLSHAHDRDLDVVLASGDAKDVTVAAKAWATVLNKAIAVLAGATIRPAQPRSTKPKKTRRSRPVGDTARMATRFAGEREIIART